MQAFIKFFLFSSIFLSILVSCNSGIKAPDVSHVEVNMDAQMFFIDLFEGGSDNIDEKVTMLNEKYGSYFEAYSQKVINIGSPYASDFPERLKAFLDYEANQDVYSKCQQEYSKVDDLMEEMKQAYRYYKYYFPNQIIPEVYFHISGFNQSIALDSAWISISVEKYLGEDCEFYEWLAIPQYLRKRMVREKVVPDVIKAMAMTSFPAGMKNNDVVSSMVEKGKVLYFVHHMVPKIKKHLLFDLSQDELNWCNKYESDIWSSMVERKDLFNTDRMVIQKYTGDSPFTYYFGQDSPGRAAVFLGYQIVSAYMDNNPELTLGDLMLEQDGHKIFQASRYRP